MKKENLNDMIKGWFVGNFEPSLIKTNDVEVAVKRYKKGDFEKSHHHKIATEVTVIIEGVAEMNGVQYKQNDMILIQPNESTDFRCIEDCTTVVVKYPGANNDKYID